MWGKFPGIWTKNQKLEKFAVYGELEAFWALLQAVQEMQQQRKKNIRAITSLKPTKLWKSARFLRLPASLAMAPAFEET
jgi:hypothetical protein